MMTDNELETKLAEAMGWHVEDRGIMSFLPAWYDAQGVRQFRLTDWHPLRDMNQAAKVAEKVSGDEHGGWSLEWFHYRRQYRASCCGFRVECDTAAGALCRAAAKALGLEV